jgi:hypothetical protein
LHRTRSWPGGSDAVPDYIRVVKVDHPEAVSGIHLLAIAGRVDVGPVTVTEDEQAYLDSLAKWHR